MSGKPIGAEDIAVLRRLQAALPDVGLNGWFEGVRVLARVIEHLTAAQQQGQGGGEVVAWRVPVVQSPFGEWLDHGVRDGLVLVMHRGTHGWKAAGQGHALLAHQLYVKNVEPLCATSHEVAVVGLSGGGWRTVWARSDDDVTHPAPPSAPVGVEARREIERAIERARVFDDGSDGADAESARSVVAILSGVLAQQPAAVDEAMVERAAAAVMSAPPGISVEAYVRIVLEAAIATKHQEPKKSKTKA